MREKERRRHAPRDGMMAGVLTLGSFSGTSLMCFGGLLPQTTFAAGESSGFSLQTQFTEVWIPFSVMKAPYPLNE